MKMRMMALTVALALGSGAAQAADGAADVIVLHASNDGEGIDDAIPDKHKLQRPPHSAYKRFKLLDRKTLDLKDTKGSTVPLPDRSQLELTLHGVEKNGDDTRCMVTAKLAAPDGGSPPPPLKARAKPKEIFFFGGQPYQGGILVVGIRMLHCKP